MGDDTIYSGTVGAAMEGYLFGIPAIAFSQVEKGWAHIDAAAAKARELVQQLVSQGQITQSPWLLNVNVPNQPLAQIKSLRVTRLGRRHSAERVITQTSPRGETMYWIGNAGAAKDDSDGTDFHATFEGHLSVTPLHVDLTEHASLTDWARSLGQPKS
jgi:5'-nucleotidase